MTPPIKNCTWATHPLGDISQWFGVNKNLYASLGLAGHNGIDIVRPWGERLYAVEDCIVANVKSDPGGYGKHVRLFSKDLKREWTYGHLAAFTIKVGDELKEGDIVGVMGNTGFVVSGQTPYWNTNPSSGTSHPGTHLHFGLRLIQEDKRGWSYPDSKIKIKTLNYSNGFKGAIDPLPYFMNPKLTSSKVLTAASVKQDKTVFALFQLLKKIGL